MHHDIVVETENALAEAGMLVDMNKEFVSQCPTVELIHAKIGEKPYVRVEGMIEFQDYQRVKRLVSAMAGLLPLLDNNFGQSQSNGATQQILTAFPGIIDMIMPSRNHMALQPFDSLKAFRLFSNLKEDCFVDSDSDNVLFHYGSQPNVKLTVFGLITSAPERTNNRVSLFDVEESQPGDANTMQIKEGFAKVFDAIAPLEMMGQVARHPSVTLYPFAVYRAISK